ncbi:MAG TPA: hypothetical protein VF541_01420 [Longimicrobium sp.]|jgi:hypothetical protein
MNVEFGCGRCWPASADAAHQASLGLEAALELIDESHFRVVIRRCPACMQQFLLVFGETIDWAHGEDPQYRARLPITAAEVADLFRRRGSLDETTLNALGPDRRCLRYKHGATEPPRSYWATGMSVPPHD